MRIHAVVSINRRGCREARLGNAVVSLVQRGEAHLHWEASPYALS